MAQQMTENELKEVAGKMRQLQTKIDFVNNAHEHGLASSFFLADFHIEIFNEIVSVARRKIAEGEDYQITVQMLNRIEFLHHFMTTFEKMNRKIQNHLGLTSDFTLKEKSEDKALRCTRGVALLRLQEVADFPFREMRHAALGTPDGQLKFKEELKKTIADGAEIMGVGKLEFAHRKFDSKEHWILKVLLNFAMCLTVVSPFAKWLITGTPFFREKTYCQQAIDEIPAQLQPMKQRAGG